MLLYTYIFSEFTVKGTFTRGTSNTSDCVGEIETISVGFVICSAFDFFFMLNFWTAKLSCDLKIITLLKITHNNSKIPILTN